MNNIIRINSITAIHQLIGLPAPKHPLISIYDDCNIQIEEQYIGQRFTSDMYLIIFKDSISGSLGYGRNAYDFQNGTLIFLAPNQVLDVPTKEIIEKSKGWTLIFHPDLI
ncbi:MAG: AraC family transcriptional regulator, partial [Chitinophagales bacterium]